MKIIGHRGAAGLALENTVESIKAAVKAGVDAIEFDIRVTKDDKLVLNHDRHLGRVSKNSHRIHEHPLSTLRELELHDGQKIATLSEAVRAAGKTPVVIEGKEGRWAQALARFLHKQEYPESFRVISFNHAELFTLSTLMPDVKTYALEHTSPFDVIRVARTLGFTGIDLNFWILNPLTYWLARYYKLEIIVYTVNKSWIASFLRVLYPRILITTDVPHQLQFLRPKSKRKLHKSSKVS